MIDLKTLPSDPGCYLFKDKDKEIIYIGKAKNLKKRVSSYFQKSHKDDKTNELVKTIYDLEVFATTNEVEALILENNLIQKHKPKYNINLKDSRRYAYIIVTDEDYPRLIISRDKNIKGRYYGPFVSGQYRDQLLKILRQSFLIRTCNKMPKRACLRYHINLCSAPCINEISKEEYNYSIKAAEDYLRGNVKILIKNLKTEMNSASNDLKFEKAKIIRDQITALDYLEQRQKVELDKRYDEDIINYIIDKNKVYLIVFNISRGVLTTKSEFSFDYSDEFLEEFITQYYSDNKTPKELILPIKLNDGSIKQYLEKLRNGKVIITVPKHGNKKELLDLVKRNIEISFLKQNLMLEDLRDKLKLNLLPNVIECFDISHIGGTNTAASMVQFRGANPDKSNYRRFKIRTVEGTDDFASIREVVSRRYARLVQQNTIMPDLIVIDGGKGQLMTALDALKELGIKIPIISLAKKFEEIYVPGLKYPIKLSKDTKALKLLMQIRDEAHRFAVKYHKLLRSKEMVR